MTHLDGDLRERLHDFAETATGTRTTALHDQVFANPCFGDDQLVNVQVVVVLGVRDCGLQALLDVLRDTLVRESQVGQSLLDFLAADRESVGPVNIGPIAPTEVVSMVVLDAVPAGLVFFSGFE